MTVGHAQNIADVLATNDRGDTITIDPGTSETRVVCGMFSYETSNVNDIESRAPMFRIAQCERQYVPRGTKVVVNSEIHLVENRLMEVKSHVYEDGSTVILELFSL